MALEYAPYAPASSIIRLLRLEREKGLTQTLDQYTFLTVKASEDTRVICRTLEFLGLLNTEKQKTDDFNAFYKLDQEEYTDLLRVILLDKYNDIFTVLKQVNQVTTEEVLTAFSKKSPPSQHVQMVRLFLALCQEAGMFLTLEPYKMRRASRGKLGKRSPAPETTAFSHASLPATLPSNKPQRQIFTFLLEQLPENGEWTQNKRERWLKAVEAATDLCVTVTDTKDSAVGSELEKE